MRVSVLLRAGFCIVGGCALLLTVAMIYAEVPSASGNDYEVVLDKYGFCGGTHDNGQASGPSISGGSGEAAVGTIATGGAYRFSSGFFSQDFIPPSAVSDFFVVPGRPARSMQLAWVSSGDDDRDYVNMPGSRVLIASTSVQSDALDPAYWDARLRTADIVISTGPLGPGERCLLDIKQIPVNTTYYFKLWMVDQAGNVSPVSTLAGGQSKEVILSVYVLEPGDYDYGHLKARQISVADRGIVIRNDGNTNEDYLLKVTSPDVPTRTVWASSTTAGFNRYVLSAVFHPQRPTIEQFGTSPGDDVLTNYDQAASTANFSAGVVSGVNIKPYMVSPLLSDTTMWMKLNMPLATTTTRQQLIPITIVATESPENQ